MGVCCGMLPPTAALLLSSLETPSLSVREFGLGLGWGLFCGCPPLPTRYGTYFGASCDWRIGAITWFILTLLASGDNGEVEGKGNFSTVCGR